MIDRIIPEPGEGAHTDYQQAAKLVKAAIVGIISELKQIPPEELMATRYEKFRKMGQPKELH